MPNMLKFTPPMPNCVFIKSKKKGKCIMILDYHGKNLIAQIKIAKTGSDYTKLVLYLEELRYIALNGTILRRNA